MSFSLERLAWLTGTSSLAHFKMSQPKGPVSYLSLWYNPGRFLQGLIHNGQGQLGAMVIAICLEWFSPLLNSGQLRSRARRS